MPWLAQAIMGGIISGIGIGLSFGGHLVLGIILAFAGGSISGKGIIRRLK